RESTTWCSADVGHRSLLPAARREERLHRRRGAVRLRRHAEHHVVDSRDGVADDGRFEGTVEGGRRVMDRRTFLRAAGAALAMGSDPDQTRIRPGSDPSSLRKAVLISMLPKDLSYARRFALAREAGFDAIEMQ